MTIKAGDRVFLMELPDPLTKPCNAYPLKGTKLECKGLVTTKYYDRTTVRWDNGVKSFPNVRLLRKSNNINKGECVSIW